MAEKRLISVDFLRAVCTLLLLADHTMAPFSHYWETVGYENEAYYWLGRLAYSCMLPLWVVLSGYLFGHKKKDSYAFDELVKSKFLRLIVPCIVLGTLWVCITNTVSNYLTPKGFILFFSGVEHLWFLPMLFWCFVYAWAIDKLPISSTKLLVLLFVLHICVWNLPSFGLLSGVYYLFWFYLGMVLSRQKNICDKVQKYCIPLLVLFCIFFVTGDYLLNIVTPSDTTSLTIWGRSYSQIAMHIVSFPYEIIGVLLLFAYSARITVMSRGLYVIAQYSMGVYLFHQFILKFLYYLAGINIPAFYMPWVFFPITLVISIILTHYISKCKAGRIIIGCNK